MITTPPIKQSAGQRRGCHSLAAKSAAARNERMRGNRGRSAKPAAARPASQGVSADAATAPAAAPLVKRRWSVAAGQSLGRAVILAS